MIRRVTTLLGTATAMVILTATGASAHECYNASRSDAGNAHAVAGQTLASYDELLAILCPAGDAIVSGAVAAHNFDTDGILIKTNALMGAGKQETDGQAIDYLPDWFSASIGQAFGACFG